MPTPKRPTDVGLVFDALVGRDDFMSRKQLHEATQLPRDRLLMAIAHLLHYHAAEAVAVGNELWYMPTPVNDTRVRRLTEIKDGITRNRSRKVRSIQQALEPVK